MELKRTCKNICKQYSAKKPASGGRYESGQGRCQTCDAWITHHGAHLRGGSPATSNSVGWICNCCNFRVRQIPRRKSHKEKFRKSTAYKSPK